MADHKNWESIHLSFNIPAPCSIQSALDPQYFNMLPSLGTIFIFIILKGKTNYCVPYFVSKDLLL